MDEKLWQFAATALDFIGDGHWPEFLTYMKELGYGEEEVEKLISRVNRKAERAE